MSKSSKLEMPGKVKIVIYGEKIQSNLKWYCVLLTCFASGAVHIEVSCIMETDSYPGSV